MAKYLYGIKSIKYGTVAATGTDAVMPASGDMNNWAQTVQGSFTLSEDESTTKEFFVEETTTAVHSVVTDAGQLKATWRAYDMTPTLIAIMKEGTAGTGAGTLTYLGPETVDSVELALEITTTNDVIIEIYRASCLARFDSVLGRENLLEMEVTATALTPENTGSTHPPYKITIPTT
jgi:hypothetical protein